jgi:hypothetical protein
VGFLSRAANRLSSLSEAECYERCHGDRGPEVRVVRMEPRRPRYRTTISGEELRRRFEERLDLRESASESAPLGEAL